MHNVLTGAELVDAVAAALRDRIDCAEDEALIGAHAALRAAVEAAGVNAKMLKVTAHWWKPECAPEDDSPSSAMDRRVTGLLRALAEVMGVGE